MVGRTILYSRAHFQTWLENGGTRTLTGNEPAPEHPWVDEALVTHPA